MPTIIDVLKQNKDAGLITITMVEDPAARFDQLGQRHYVGKQRASSTQCFEIEVQGNSIGILQATKLKQNLMLGIQQLSIASPDGVQSEKLFHPYSVSDVAGHRNRFIISVPNYCDMEVTALKSLTAPPIGRSPGA